MDPVFPTLLAYGFVAALLLRITLAAFFIIVGIQMVRSKRISLSAYFEANAYPLAPLLPILLSVLCILTGLFFVFGFFTQVAALIATYVLLNIMLIEHRDEHLFKYTQFTYLLLMIIAAALLFLGPGTLAFDQTI